MEKSKTVAQRVDDALVHERMCSRMNTIIDGLSAERKKHIREAKQSGEKVDKSYTDLMDILSAVRADIQQKANDLWAEVDAESEKYSAGYELLANAVLERAALDYESALCGCGSDSQKWMIEKFAKEGAEMFTQLDFMKVLQRIEAAHKDFMKVVRERGADIIEETNRIHRSRNDMRKSRLKCPMCGGGLYSFGKPIGGYQTIRCTGCNLSAQYRVRPK